MPKPRPDESEKEFVARCVPLCIKEGLDKKAALGKCYGIYRQARGGKEPVSKAKMKTMHKENSQYF